MITAEMVSELRTRTDAPMLECKMCLTMCEGNIDKAEEMIRTGGSRTSNTLILMDVLVRLRLLEQTVAAQKRRIDYLETQTGIFGRS